MRRPFRLAACALLAGCAHRPPQPLIDLLASGDECGCRFEAEGRIVAEGDLHKTETMLVQAARRWKRRSATILGGPEIPFKCFGLALFVLQSELPDGRIGFIAEPPPEPK